jgi:hypothetical protein
MEEYEAFEYFTGKKHFAEDVSSFLEIDELKIPQEEELTLLSESEHRKIQISCVYFLDIQRADLNPWI